MIYNNDDDDDDNDNDDDDCYYFSKYSIIMKILEQYFKLINNYKEDVQINVYIDIIDMIIV